MKKHSPEAQEAVVAFQTEVMRAVEWARIRDDFVRLVEQSSRARTKEPKKLERHLREALGKWVLAQVAHQPKLNPAQAHGGTDTVAPPFFPVGRTYDDQLLSDLEMKITAEPGEIQRILQKLELNKRCEEAVAKVQEAVESGVFDAERLVLHAIPSDGRISGAALEINVVWAHGRSHAGLFPIRIPQVAWDRLVLHWQKVKRCFRANPKDEAFIHYAAAMVIRYEVVLNTGSVQLCADSALKDFLCERGLAVMDLCASPINGYAPPAHIAKTLPVFPGFCTAFPDTDEKFGSRGSALTFDPIAHAKAVKRPMLYTLDVPYDEDLCEQLFLKLLRDVDAVKKHNEAHPDDKANVAWVIVIPLWWDLDFLHTTKLGPPMSCRDREGSGAGKGATSSYYTWTGLLERCPWVCYDRVFPKNSYTYFCCSTNQPLGGVTDTELIGVQAPGADISLARLLSEFFVDKPDDGEGEERVEASSGE